MSIAEIEKRRAQEYRRSLAKRRAKPITGNRWGTLPGIEAAQPDLPKRTSPQPPSAGPKPRTGALAKLQMYSLSTEDWFSVKQAQVSLKLNYTTVRRNLELLYLNRELDRKIYKNAVYYKAGNGKDHGKIEATDLVFAALPGPGKAITSRELAQKLHTNGPSTRAALTYARKKYPQIKSFKQGLYNYYYREI